MKVRSNELRLNKDDLQVKIITADAPSSGAVAPPGYYLLHVVYKEVPSVAVWVQIR
ncbi:hypothetical protein WN943_014592 [Citrus x changshan-huyou]